MPDDLPQEPDTEPTPEPVAEPASAQGSDAAQPAPEVVAEKPEEAEEPQTEVPAEASAEAEETIPPQETHPEPPAETAQRENEPFTTQRVREMRDVGRPSFPSERREEALLSEAEPEPPQEQPEDVPEAEAPVEPIPAPEPATTPPPVQAAPPPASSFANFTTRAKEMLIKARTAIQNRKRKKLNKILVLLDEKKNIGNDDVEKLLHVSDATATRYLNQLEREGKIIQVGARRREASSAR